MKTPDHVARQVLQDAIARMPRDTLPSRDLWPGIAHALHERPRHSTLGGQMALAASILLVVFGSIYFGMRQPLQSAEQYYFNDFLSSLESDHLRSKQALLTQYKDETAVYPQWQEQLQQLESAEQVIYRALREDPENTELLSILQRVQSKQLGLIDSAFSSRLSSL
jgi:hypothetical protein